MIWQWHGLLLLKVSADISPQLVLVLLNSLLRDFPLSLGKVVFVLLQIRFDLVHKPLLVDLIECRVRSIGFRSLSDLVFELLVHLVSSHDA